MVSQQDSKRKFWAGMFFVASLAVIVTVVFVIGIEKGLTEPKLQMTAIFRNVGGLTIGAPVRLSGVTVGTVGDINFLEEEIEGRGVKVVLDLYRKYERQLHKSQSIAIITEGVLGEKIVDITTASDFVRRDLSVPVIGKDPLDVQNLAETFRDAALSLQETSVLIVAIIEDMEDISSTTKRVLNRLEQRIIEGNLFKVF